jgi:tripartite-type tricarboxylate transporter receptor subunit TctC
MPELATFAEQGVKGFELDIWVGAYAPGGTPKPIRERLQRELRAIINEPDVTKRMHDQGQVPIGNTPDEFAANFQADAPKWAELIRASGAKVE